jgi:hypothetical protein
MKKIITILIILVLVVLGVYFIINSSSNNEVSENQDEENNIEENSTSTVDDNTGVDVIDVPDDSESFDYKRELVIGKSFNGNDIKIYKFGNGEKELVFVGGFHGGYEWNTVLVAYEMIDYLTDNEDVISDNLTVSIIPVLNPDGLEKVVGTTGRFSKSDVPVSQSETVVGRFNGNGVDLNRNFDCDWQSIGVWQDITVDGGDSVFSEPESKVFRNYINSNNPEAVVVWYSAAPGVFASNCHDGVLEETKELTNLYAEASGYPAYEEFDFYEITGDAVNWLAKKDIPAISVLLSDHENTEWNKNVKGIEALFNYYSN